MAFTYEHKKKISAAMKLYWATKSQAKALYKNNAVGNAGAAAGKVAGSIVGRATGKVKQNVIKRNVTDIFTKGRSWNGVTPSGLANLAKMPGGAHALKKVASNKRVESRARAAGMQGAKFGRAAATGAAIGVVAGGTAAAYEKVKAKMSK